MIKSWQLRLLMWVLRTYKKPRLARMRDVALGRQSFERSMRRSPVPAYTTFLDDAVGGIPGQWAWCKPKRPEVLLYLHGGAHIVGSPRTHRAMVARLCKWTGLRAFLPDFRLAPEHPFPASLEDSRAVWDGLIARGYPADRIFIAGDSAGGGLAFALLADLLADDQRPRAILGFSPWTDLSLSSASYTENAERECFLPASQGAFVQEKFLAGADPKDPRASPLFADFPSPPPAFLQVTETEILRDDTLALADKLRDAGGRVTLDLWPDGPHAFPLFQGRAPEADEALSRAEDFVLEVLRAPPAGGS